VEGTERYFTKRAERYARDFRMKGLDKPSRLLSDALCRIGVQSRSLLDIGCGVGGLHLSLLEAGAGNAQGVEISEGMLAEARALAAERGLSDRVSYHTGDFVSTNDAIGMADIVILDKVVCCYPDARELIANSAQKARELYAVSYPRDSFLARLLFKPYSRIGELLHWPFHPYYHDADRIDSTIVECGYQEAYSDNTIIWQVKIFRRGKV
jgi:magnesium-protoporphyrin O-methyltransferase